MPEEILLKQILNGSQEEGDRKSWQSSIDEEMRRHGLEEDMWNNRDGYRKTWNVINRYKEEEHHHIQINFKLKK